MSLKGITTLGAMLLLSSLAVGQTNKPSTEEISSSKGLSGAAEKTYANYNRAFQAGVEKVQEVGAEIEIPSTYWTEPIKALRPIKVYLHRANIVVVQRINTGIEEGKYIYISISSYLPQNGVDGFEFTPNPLQGNRYYMPNNVLEFKRIRSK